MAFSTSDFQANVTKMQQKTSEAKCNAFSSVCATLGQDSNQKFMWEK